MTWHWLVIGLCGAWVAFAYAGYPLALWWLARCSPRPVRAADRFPPVSVVVAVRNGEALLRRKLEATLSLGYPGDVEVLVASDGSTDGTDAIARSMADRGVVLVRSAERRGKEAAQAAAIQKARGEILVFTDLAAELEPGALRQIVRPFADPSVGCVSSEDVVDPAGEGTYVRLEMALRRLETRAATLVGVSGSCFAVRRELCSPWPADLASDFRSALEACRRGMRAVAEPGARACFGTAQENTAEWQRKVRTVRRGLAVLCAYRDLLHPRQGRVALSLWGHKVARYTSPFALVAILVASALAAPASELAALLLATQLAVYAAGATGLWGGPAARWAPTRLAAFFLLVNASIVVAWIHHLSGRRVVTWEPTQREA